MRWSLPDWWLLAKWMSLKLSPPNVMLCDPDFEVERKEVVLPYTSVLSRVSLSQTPQKVGDQKRRPRTLSTISVPLIRSVVGAPEPMKVKCRLEYSASTNRFARTAPL